MKMKKAMLMSLCAVMLVASSIMGTLAYMTSQDEVKNTFTVGQMAIKLDETDVNEYGVKDGEERNKGNDYKLIPGHHYVKDPIVHLAPKSEACYVYVHIENQLVGAIKDGHYKTPDATGSFYMPALGIDEQMTDAGWKLMSDTAKNGKSYMVWMKEVDAATAKTGTNLKTFEYFDVDGAKKQADLEKYADKTITVSAYACQQDGFDNAKAAWDACFATAKK